MKPAHSKYLVLYSMQVVVEAADAGRYVHMCKHGMYANERVEVRALVPRQGSIERRLIRLFHYPDIHAPIRSGGSSSPGVLSCL